MLKAIGVVLLVALGFCLGGMLACKPPQAPSAEDVAITTSYGARLSECVFAAKEMDASVADKHASADTCMCAVAADAGQASDPVLHCEGGAP